MLFILIKNNFKLFLRNKTMVLMFTVFPVLTITILSTAFSLDLKNDYVLESFKVGYSLEKGSETGNYFNQFKESLKDVPVTFIELPKDEAIQALKDNELACYVEFSNQKYTLYKNQGLNIHTVFAESTLDQIVYLYDTVKELINANPVAETLSNMPVADGVIPTDDSIELRKLNADPIPDAQDYYGIVQTVFFIWFGIVGCATFTEGERKNGVACRFAMTKANATILYLGRFIPATCSLCFQVGISLVTSTILLNINWGPYPLLSFSLLLFEIIAVSAFGTTLSFMIKNTSFINICAYITSFIFGAIGGCFQTYMYNTTEDVAKWSPLYYINRTLVELSTKGSSTYLFKTIIFLCSVIFLSLSAGLIYTKVRGYKNECV